MSIGATLRSEREKRGISLLDVENETKIRAKYIEALEDENFEEIPGEVYVVGFLRNYARYLDFDPEQILDDYRSASKLDVEEKAEPVEVRANPAPQLQRRTLPVERQHSLNKGSDSYQRKLIYALYGVVAILVLVLIVWGASALLHQKSAVRQNQATAKKQPVVTVKPKPVLAITLKATQDCWVQVTVDGQVALSTTLKPGESKSFQGEKSIYLVVGNAGGIDVTYNNQKIPPIGTGAAVVKKEFRPSTQ